MFWAKFGVVGYRLDNDTLGRLYDGLRDLAEANEILAEKFAEKGLEAKELKSWDEVREAEDTILA
ncbi:MAG: hypothetical protein ACOVS5_11315 [Oligoflexus sp.]